MTAGRTNHTQFASAPRVHAGVDFAHPAFPNGPLTFVSGVPGFENVHVHQGNVDAMGEEELRAFIFGEVKARPAHEVLPAAYVAELADRARQQKMRQWLNGEWDLDDARNTEERGLSDSEGGEL